jgi:alpha-galactosidase
MWRISDDFWDDWKLLRKQFDYTRDWAAYAGIDGTWPDADMLPLGKLRITDAKGGPQDSKFSADEKQTMMTLWAMVRSPLMIGGDLPTLDPKTLALITNPEVLAVNQDSAHGQQLFEKGSIRAWSADGQNGAVRYIALFNLGSDPAEATYALTDFGIRQATADIRDLWSRRTLGRAREIAVKLPAHGSALYSLRAR